MLDIFVNAIVKSLAQSADLAEKDVRNALSKPPKPEMGDYAFPCFPLAKTLRKAPPAIAGELAPSLNEALAEKGIEAEAAGPYVNFRLNRTKVVETVLAACFGQDYLPDDGVDKTVVIDFSSPNIAKPFSMGHLRSTTIGNSLAAIYRALGYEVVRVNHLGDWGTQFGKLISAFRRWGSREELEAREIDYLMEIYVRFNDAAKEDPALEDEARAAFRALEDGEEEAVALWKEFREISLREFKRIYERLGVGFDSWAGESFYNERIESAVEAIDNKNLLEESEGATVVRMDDDIPPCMLRKSDGATTYAARDLAAIFYRQETYHFNKLLYVVGAPQSLHFKQVFSVLEKMGLDYAHDCEHVPFGQVLIGGELMSTRRGNVVFLEDVIARAEELALEKLMEDQELAEADEALRERAERIAVSSIIFFDLKNGRNKDVDFNWEEILNPRGETGIYLQYAHARIHGIIRKFEERLAIQTERLVKEALPVSEEAAYPIVSIIATFPEKLRYAAESNEPSVISRFLLDMTSAFSTYYRANKVILEDNPELAQERMQVVLAVRDVLGRGLRLLGIEPLERM